MAMPPLAYSFRPVVSDQHTAARGYFLCIIAMLFLESLLRLPGYLPGFTKRKHQPNHPLPLVLLHKLTTFPSPIPLLTHHPLLSLLRLLLFTSLNLLWGWTRIRYSTDYQLYGWLTLANGGLALLLPTRNNLFSLITRIPPPTLLMYHRWAGLATVTHASLHFGLTAQHYVRTRQLETLLENPRIRVGLVAWGALVVIFITSLRIVRRRGFEVFYYLHFVFLVFVGGALYHATSAFEFLLPGLILWVVDRTVRCYGSFWTRRGVVVTEVVRYPAGRVTKIRFEGGRMAGAGQMAWVQIPSVSVANWHPFTVVSAPGGKGGILAVRGLGSYTSEVQRLGDTDGSKEEAASMGGVGKMLRIRLDGPYGVEAMPWARFPVVVLVAGGIGITSAMSIASYLVNQGANRGGSPGEGERHIHLLWCVSEISHACWFEEELRTLVGLGLPSISLEISIYVTGGVRLETEEEGVAGSLYNGPGEVHRGRPDMGGWFRQLKEKRPMVDGAVNLCGPRSLIDDARRAAADASNGRGLFYVQEGVFEF